MQRLVENREAAPVAVNAAKPSEDRLLMAAAAVASGIDGMEAWGVTERRGAAAPTALNAYEVHAGIIEITYRCR